MPDRPDVLWIYCDELRTDALGCYGNAQAAVRTPHIDSIAQTGARFDRCYCNSPVCVPSRMATLTGLYPEDTGVYHNEAAWKPFRMPRPATTFPEVFAQQGYATADFGKMHLPGEMQPWQHRRSEGGEMSEIFKHVGPGDPTVIIPTGVRTYLGGRFPAGAPFPPEQVTRNGLEWIAAQRGPFLARLSYLQPHTPVYPPPPFDTMYDPSAFRDHPTPVAATLSEFEKAFAAVVRAETLTPQQIRLTQSYYYGLVAWIDSQIARVLAALRELGLDRRTIVVFGADHGASLGEAGCYAKHIFAPQVHRVPFLVSWLGELPGGSVRGDLCDSLDLGRTLFALCGIETPPQFKGRDLFGDPPPQAVFATIGYGLPDSRAFPNARVGDYRNGRPWPRRACVRTDRYRLDRNVRIDGKPAAAGDLDVFLADCQADPAEQINLAGRPELRQVEQHLNGLLEAHLAGAIEPDPACVGRATGRSP